jgi:MarR family transcriptional regulator, 2-MHQ and catechol-resistance regulon repressor
MFGFCQGSTEKLRGLFLHSSACRRGNISALKVNMLTDTAASEDSPEPPDAASASSTADTDALVVYNVLRTHGSLSPHIDRDLRELNLTGAQLNALLVLRDAGPEGLPLSEVGRHLVVTKANVTGLMDRLEREGLVRRNTHADRRVTLAKLTDKGVALLEEAVPRRQQVLAELLGGLNSAEKEQLISLLTKLRRGIREQRQAASKGET